MTREPIKLYRLWCGRKRHSHWLPDLDAVWRLALDKGLAYGDERGAGLGPLTWIEHGERKGPKARTIRIKCVGLPPAQQQPLVSTPLPSLRAASPSYGRRSYG